MPDKDLRRQALESGKTVSRKQKAKHLYALNSQASSAANSPTQSPLQSPGASRPGSQTNSCAPSRHGSDEEDDDSDVLTSSIGSLDLGGFLVLEKARPEAWRHELNEVMDQVIERSRNKRNTAEAREETLAIFTNILRAQYASEEVSTRLQELVAAFVKCFKAGSTEREAIFALKALAITLLTTGEPIFTEIDQALRTRIQDEEFPAVQEAALHTLGAATFFGGADLDETEDIMEFLLDIVESDGESINALDCGQVVAAALQEWGLLATQFENLEDKTERPLESFHLQLDSADLGVLQAAGYNIALLLEQSYTRVSEGDEPSDEDGIDDEFEFGQFKRKYWAKRYDVLASNEFALNSRLAELAKSSARHMGKDKRKDLHKTFSDVLHTVEHPWRGPRFSTALNEEMTSYMGHRHVVRMGKSAMTVNRWWKYHRYEAIKRIVGGGFAIHYQANEVVYGSLPKGLEAPADF